MRQPPCQWQPGGTIIAWHSSLEDRTSAAMTLAQFVTKNAFRNRRRSILTVLSITFSLLLLTIMMAVWRGFNIDQGAPDSALRIMTRHRVSLAFFLPGYYRDKIRALPGVVHVVPMTWFGGKYKDDRPENFFAQFATDPSEYMEVAADKIVPAEQAKAWQQDRTGCLVDQALAAKHGWKIGDRIILLGNIFPANLELTVRAIYTMDPPNNSLYFHAKYLEESIGWFKDRAGFYFTRVNSPNQVAHVSRAIDDMFHNLPEPTGASVERLSSQSSSSPPTPWPCRFANAPAKSPCYALSGSRADACSRCT
jgi:putative ABC transport system permease protein